MPISLSPVGSALVAALLAGACAPATTPLPATSPLQSPSAEATSFSPVNPSALQWASIGTVPDIPLSGLVSFDEGYVAFGERGNLREPLALHSADGRTWDATPLAAQVRNCPGWGPAGDEDVPDADISAGATNGRAVVLVGAEHLFTAEACRDVSASIRSEAWISSDGRSWKRSPGFGSGNTNARASGVWPVAAGWQAVEEMSGGLWQSANGTDWREVSTTAGAQRFGIHGGANAFGTILAQLEPADGSSPPVLSRSADGITWTPLAGPTGCDGVIDQIMPPASNGSGSWLVVSDGTICVSSDLQHWRSARLPITGGGPIYALIESRYGLLASAQTGCAGCPPGKWFQFVSADGLRWTQLPLAVEALRMTDGPAGVIGIGGGTVWKLMAVPSS